MVEGRNEHVLSALEKGLDRKTQSPGSYESRDAAKSGEAATLERKVTEHRDATVEMSFEFAQQRFYVVACNLCKGTRLQAKKG